jgi:hypothetical protein
MSADVDFTMQPFAPGTTPEYSGVLVDANGNPIAGSQLTTLTLSLVDTVTKAVVNSCTDANILNTGRGTIDALGNLKINFLKTDTQLLDTTHKREYRSAVIIWTYNAGAGVGTREVKMMITKPSGT